MTELNGRTATYGYDDANQLTSETITGAPVAAQNGIVAYVLDAVGNRRQRNSTIAAILSTANSFDANDRLNSDSYDQNGNTIAADGKTYAYDFRDKLKRVNNGQIGIGYDGDGQRVSKTVGGVTTNYLVDDNNPTGYAQVVEELVGGQVRRVYSYGNMLIAQRQLVGASWVTSHYGHDGGENVRQLFDNAGAVTDTWDYDAFGIVIGRTGTTANSYLYRGQQFDADLGFYYQRARYYQQGRGRFSTQDGFEGFQREPRSLHKYSYANADPVNGSDPSGLLSLAEQHIIRAEEHKSLKELEKLAAKDSCTIYKLGSVIRFDIADLVPLTYCAVRFEDPDFLDLPGISTLTLEPESGAEDENGKSAVAYGLFDVNVQGQRYNPVYEYADKEERRRGERWVKPYLEFGFDLSASGIFLVNFMVDEIHFVEDGFDYGRYRRYWSTHTYSLNPDFEQLEREGAITNWELKTASLFFPGKLKKVIAR